MVNRNINNGKLKISKKLIALMLAGTCTFSLAGCKNNSESRVKKNSDRESRVMIGAVEKEPIIEENINESSSNYLSIKYLFNDDSIEFAENMYAQIGLFDLDNRLIECWVSCNSEIPIADN